MRRAVSAFFSACLGPAFAEGTDTLLLQLLSEPLETGKLQLFTDLAKELVAFIDLDRAATAQKIYPEQNNRIEGSFGKRRW